MSMEEQQEVPSSQVEEAESAEAGMEVDSSETETSIWHLGPPAQAIQTAVTQGKLFLVWIEASRNSEQPSHDTPSEETSSWDSLWTNQEIRSILLQNAVSLKLGQGTTDAAMFLQLVGAPSTAEGAWIVFAGQLLDTIPSPPSNSEEMVQRIQSTLSKSEELKRAPALAALTSSQPVTAPQPQVSESMQAQLASRRERLEAAKRKYDREIKEQKKAAAAKHSTSTDPERQKYITQQAKERAQQKQDRAKILQEIENDRLERKLRAERQARLHQEELSTEAVSSSVPAKVKEGKGKVEEGVTMISVRFPDSSVLKGRFEGGKTLKDVRSWIDETRNMSTAPPYVFQTTFPTRTFEVSEEEHETLSSLFGKGGQVVLKEIKTYSQAYVPSSPGVVGIASSLLGSVTGTISSALGWNTPPAPQQETNEQDRDVPGAAIREARIRNVNYSARERGVNSDTGDDREKNWFNGNGLAQEAPPRDDERKTD